MKIVVVSDSHGNLTLLQEILNKNYDADYFIHLGDFELPTYLMSSFLFVKGNCDYLVENNLYKDIVIGGLKIHLEHGDKINYSDFDNYIISKHCAIFLFGHIHKKIALKIDNTYVFNPGSLTRPRDSNKGSYLLLIIDNNKNITYKFEEINLD